jgi:hypothetical protein
MRVHFKWTVGVVLVVLQYPICGCHSCQPTRGKASRLSHPSWISDFGGEKEQASERSVVALDENNEALLAGNARSRNQRLEQPIAEAARCDHSGLHASWVW